MKVKSLSRVRLLATPWTAAYQAPPPMGFSRQEYWSGVPLPSPVLVSTVMNQPYICIYTLPFGDLPIMAQLVKNLPAMWETWVQSLGWEDPLEKENATHSSILAWKIP